MQVKDGYDFVIPGGAGRPPLPPYPRPSNVKVKSCLLVTLVAGEERTPAMWNAM